MLNLKQGAVKLGGESQAGNEPITRKIAAVEVLAVLSKTRTICIVGIAAIWFSVLLTIFQIPFGVGGLLVGTAVLAYFYFTVDKRVTYLSAKYRV